MLLQLQGTSYHPEGLLETDFCIPHPTAHPPTPEFLILLVWDRSPRICISSKFSDSTDVVDLEPMGS